MQEKQSITPNNTLVPPTKKRPPQFLPINGSSTRNKTICFVAGHSGGHIIPCLTLAHTEYANEHDILFFTSRKSLDHDIVRSSEIPLTHSSLPIEQQRNWGALICLPFFLLWATIKSFFMLIAHRPERIITTGSTLALPICIAGWLLNIPIELFELNAHPGKTIRFLAPVAHTIRHCFATTRDFFPRHHCILTNYPIRFTDHPSESSSLEGFETKRTTLFVQGGSQGSQQLNTLMQQLLTDHPSLANTIQIIHQTGAHPTEVKKKYDALHIPAHVFIYEPTLAPYYRQADLIICRAGAGTLFETLFFQKKCITLPLIATAHNHQLKNAQAMVQEYPQLFQVACTQQEAIECIKKALE